MRQKIDFEIFEKDLIRVQDATKEYILDFSDRVYTSLLYGLFTFFSYNVIALLLSILVPALSKAKEQAVSVVCRSNLRQNQLVLILYLDANNDCFPPTTTAGAARWHVLLDVQILSDYE